MCADGRSQYLIEQGLCTWTSDVARAHASPLTSSSTLATVVPEPGRAQAPTRSHRGSDEAQNAPGVGPWSVVLRRPSRRRNTELRQRPGPKQKAPAKSGRPRSSRRSGAETSSDGKSFDICHTAIVVIAAITSCTNTSNPAVMVAAGLVAKNAVKKGLGPSRGSRRAWPRVLRSVTEYLEEPPDCCERTSRSSASIWSATAARPASATRVRSTKNDHQGGQGARARRDLGAVGQPQLRGPRHRSPAANYLASPPLVVAYALAGSTSTSTSSSEPIGKDSPEGQRRPAERHLAHATAEDQRSPHAGARSRAACSRSVRRASFEGHRRKWRAMKVPRRSTSFEWDDSCTYIRRPPFFEGLEREEPMKPFRPTSRARACWRCSATRSRPTTSRPPAPSPRTARQAEVPHRTTALPRQRLQQLRQPPRQPRGHDARHLRQHPPAQSARAGHRRWLHPPPARR